MQESDELRVPLLDAHANDEAEIVSAEGAGGGSVNGADASRPLLAREDIETGGAEEEPSCSLRSYARDTADDEDELQVRRARRGRDGAAARRHRQLRCF